jgi:phosphoribosyl-ATP pyrophosphohydrolase/phosphoribosyl-AMP cyclohydrolase
MSIVPSLLDAVPVDLIRYNDQGLVPAIVQDHLDGTVLMMAWMNPEALRQTLTTGETWFWSRSRQTLWHKGATSGHTQRIQTIRYDCDSDALLVTVEQQGEVACHTGERSCFHQVGNDKVLPPADTLSQVFAVITQRRLQPDPNSYTCKLLEGEIIKFSKKSGKKRLRW